MNQDQQRRIEAMTWWNELEERYKQQLAIVYYGRDWKGLTGREIQILYETKFKTGLL